MAGYSLGTHMKFSQYKMKPGHVAKHVNILNVVAVEYLNLTTR
jgi:hypothetical protein